ncbi:MAG: hypothetical protein IPN94_26230 [Sphingobacteriales bacterium]|nr:hypothetical protein [Sphingobacteriales bacterium]
MFQANFSSAFLTFTKKLLFVLLLFTVSGQFLKAQPLPDIATSSLSNMFTATNTSPFDYQRIKRAVIINATGADLSAKYVAQRASIASKILSNFNAMKSANAITNTTTTYAYLGSPILVLRL